MEKKNNMNMTIEEKEKCGFLKLSYFCFLDFLAQKKISLELH